MVNKILGLIIAAISLITGLFSVFLIINSEFGGWQLLAGSSLGVLAGVVVYRHGLKTAIKAYGEGIDKPFKN